MSSSPSSTGGPSRPSFGGSSGPSLPQIVLELRDLIVTYFKQETLLPLKRLRRYLVWGVLGSLLMGVGVLLLALGLLRLLQNKTGSTFTGDWSWAPYLIVFAALIAGAALTWTARRTFRSSKESA